MHDSDMADEQAQWAADREFRAVQRAERARIALLPLEEQQSTFIRLLGDHGSVQEACEFMGISRHVVACWRRSNPEVAAAIQGANEAAYDLLESWLHDYGRGFIHSGPGQVDTQWRLFYFRRKHLVGDEGKITIRVVYEDGSGKAGLEIQLPAANAKTLEVPGLKEWVDGN